MLRAESAYWDSYKDGITTVLGLALFAITSVGGFAVALFGKQYELIPALALAFAGMMIVVVGAGGNDEPNCMGAGR